jgi:membrane protein YdbS with pleckstrin-like domain
VTDPSFDPRTISRADPRLQTYYLLVALAAGPLYPVVVLPLLFKYHTLRYRFDDAGMSMSWGVLFRREIYLTYRRIQDIHVTRNLLQRWLGLATVSIQTASGSATPEMMIEGILEAEALRDFLYQQMRGARAEQTEGTAAEGRADSDGPAALQAQTDEALALLHDIRAALEACARSRSSPEGKATRNGPRSGCTRESGPRWSSGSRCRPSRQPCPRVPEDSWRPSGRPRASCATSRFSSGSGWR